MRFGGTQDLLLDTCPPRAGDRYVVLGSAGGTSPGIAIDGLTMPLVQDAYFAVTAPVAAHSAQRARSR